MTTAFVLSGGGNLGAAQVGMLLAIREWGARPDLVIGSSVGALNGALVASETDLTELGDIWRSLRRERVFPTQPIGGCWGSWASAITWSATMVYGGCCATTCGSRRSRKRRSRSTSP